ncbi:MAG: phosphoglucosamine mutase [Verrucomicrobia bacterium]|nr:phosphoglucosamine mutase [Verrucomicrobiota bacterium]
MNRKHFGTDGLRGIANHTLTPELAFKVGFAAGIYVRQQRLDPKVILGRDTRRSGPMLGAALASGFCSAGIEVMSLGIVPTGCVSFVTRTGAYGMGSVISASHNPAPDNGIKLIGHDGRKLPDEAEEIIEALMANLPDERPVGAGVGDLVTSREEVARYMDYLETLVPESLEGIRVTVDGAHGAAYELGPEIFRRLGANVDVIGCKPDGMNINSEGGATKPHAIQGFTKAEKPHLGVSFDGDADRVVFSDEQGRLINGDRTLGLWCAHWRKCGGLEPPLVVGTLMTNGGFEKYMAEQGIRLERTAVGDKYVSAKLIELDAKVGGEQSGHIIFSRRGPTGDGLITALEVLRVIKREGRSASEFYGDFENWPQLLVNVSLPSRDGWNQNEEIVAALKHAETAIEGHGRVMVRASGTQPMVRVMVEADCSALRDKVADSIVGAMERALAGKVYSRVDLTYSLGE